MLCKLSKILYILAMLGTSTGSLRAGELVNEVTAYTLPNGLKVLLYPEHSSPELTVNVVYRTGSKHESGGEYGMAHLLEHMLYKGSRLETQAARYNASTNADRTSYYETLPASLNNLEFALSIEADRMSRGQFSDDAVRSELSVVKNEWEHSDGSGFQPLLKEMLQIAYPHHAYGRDTLGVQDGLMQIKPEALRRFYQKRYAPNLAILAIGGDFRKEDAQRLIEKYFAPLTAPAIDESILMLEPAPQQSEKQVALRRESAGSYVGVLYRAMKGSDPELVAAQALVHALGSGSQSLLQKELVRKGLAREAFGFVQQNADESFIAFFARPALGQDPQILVQKLAALVEKASTIQFSAADLNRFALENNQAWAEMMRDSRTLTMQLADYEILSDWQQILREQQIARRLQAEDLQTVGRWLNRSNRTLGVLDDRPSPVLRPAANGTGQTPGTHVKLPAKRMFKPCDDGLLRRDDPCRPTLR